LVLAAILAVVSAQAAQAAEVVSRLENLGFAWAGPGPVYSYLHTLAKAGLLSWSVAAAEGGRSARRRYDLSPLGQQVLAAWAVDLEALSWKLSTWSREYANVASSLQGMPGAQ